MTGFRLPAVVTDPRSLKALADERSELAAVGANAAGGVLIVLSAALSLSFFTNTLAVLMGVLFGPLAGFLLSSVYPRVEFVAGRRLGGKAELDEIYRLFAWSFLYVGVASLISSALLLLLNTAGTLIKVLLALPSLALVVLAGGAYCSNVIAAQKFTVTKGIMALTTTLLLFILLVIGSGAAIVLVYKYGMSEMIKIF